MPLALRGHFASPAILWSFGVTLATLTFGRIQNQGHLIGGEISLAKTLWLNLTILTFLVLPALWWRDGRIDPTMRSIFGVIFASFAVRAGVELPILYLTDWWRCSYGIAHDLGTAMVITALFIRARYRQAQVTRDSAWLFGLVAALLVVEAGFAEAFCSVADPGSGIYFASDDPTFRTINRATWAAVIGGYSILSVVLIHRSRRL